MQLVQQLFRGLRKSIIVILKIIVNMLSIIIEVLNVKPSNINRVSKGDIFNLVDSKKNVKRNFLTFTFYSTCHYTITLYKIVDFLNQHDTFLKFGRDRVFIISTVCSNGVVFNFNNYIKTEGGKINTQSLDIIINKFNPQYIVENYGSSEEFTLYKVTVRSLLE